MTSIRVPFSINASGKVAKALDPQVIAEQQIIDVLTTDKFERVLRPDYGASAQQLLFEPMDELVFSEFKMDALQELNRNLTIATVSDIRIRPVSVPVTGDEGQNVLEIWVRYKMLPFTQTSFTFRITAPSYLTEESIL
jgi:phage baseplate assembly protein W